eukprot:928244-Prorocentrum_minimum.AAC.1
MDKPYAPRKQTERAVICTHIVISVPYLALFAPTPGKCPPDSPHWPPPRAIAPRPSGGAPENLLRTPPTTSNGCRFSCTFRKLSTCPPLLYSATSLFANLTVRARRGE